MRCVKVYLACRDGAKRIPYWERVYRGYSFDGCRVAYAYPSECVLTPSTAIDYVSWCEYREEELQNNVKIVEKCEDVERVYIYPKKPYYELKKLYIEPLAKGEQPFNIGVILCGPPGTGKTTAAKIIAKMLGISVLEIVPDKILNMYVGQSEKALREVLETAKRVEPTVIVIDDAEWLLSARRLASSTENSQVMLNLQNILFNEMQEMYNRGSKVLFVASTNVKPTEIDIAFVRQGRFGQPIFIPLPDYEAVYHFLLQFFDPQNADRYARKFVNMGLSIADVIGMVKRIKSGLDAEKPSSSGRGYTRVFVDPVDGFERIFDLFPREALNKRSRIYMNENEDVATAIIAQMGYAAKKPVIRMIDIRYYDEAVYTANTLGGILIASTSFPREVQLYIHENAEGPVFFVGKQPPYVDTFPFFSLSELRSLRKQILEAVLRYKGIQVEGKLVDKMLTEASDTTRFGALLEMISVLGHIDEKIVSRLAYLVQKR